MPRKKLPRVRKGQLDVGLSKAEFARRFQVNFFDPRFARTPDALETLTEIAWRNYQDDRKAPRTVAAGRRFADPAYELSVEWLAARRLSPALRHARGSVPRPPRLRRHPRIARAIAGPSRR